MTVERIALLTGILALPLFAQANPDLERARRVFEAEKDVPEAMRTFVAAEPANPWGSYYKGIAEREARRLTAARQALAEAERAAPNIPAIIAARGMASVMSFDPAGAAHHYERLARVSSGDAALSAKRAAEEHAGYVQESARARRTQKTAASVIVVIALAAAFLLVRRR